MLYSRDYTEQEKSNEIQFKIEPSGSYFSGPKNTTWIKKGLHEVEDNFESGYSLTITLQYDDSEIRKVIINILQHHRFGSFPSSHTIHAHLDDEAPTSNGAEKILNNIQFRSSRSPQRACKRYVFTTRTWTE